MHIDLFVALVPTLAILSLRLRQGVWPTAVNLPMWARMALAVVLAQVASGIQAVATGTPWRDVVPQALVAAIGAIAVDAFGGKPAAAPAASSSATSATTEAEPAPVVVEKSEG